MSALLRRHWLLVVLAVALLVNLAIYWPAKNSARDSRAAGRSSLPMEIFEDSTSPEGRRREAQFRAMVEKLPAEQRKVVEDRTEADRAFFASIKNLSAAEQREKMEEHLQRNPPPPALAGWPRGGFSPPADGGMPGGPNPGDPGSPGGSGPGAHIPPPEIRRSMDQQIADSQRNEGTP